MARLEETYIALHALQKELKNQLSIHDYPEALQTDVTYHGTETAALKAVSRELGLVDNTMTSLVVSSSKEQAWFEEMVPRVDRFPLLFWQGSKTGHSLDTYPWQADLVKKMMSRYLGMGAWLYRVMREAAYYDIPVGNITGDEPLFYTDIDYARRLLKKDMVLWWSSSGKPDLGGLEEDGFSTDELVNPEINTPGCYSNVCISIQVKRLALNAVAQSAIVNEMEGAGGATAFDSTSHTLDEYAKGDARGEASLGDTAVSPQAFAVMKEMIKSWLDRKDGGAHLGLDHFWRWLSSGSARMFDPGLQRFVHGLMKKTFLQMLAEFRRLGSNVIAAEFGQILLLTAKPPGTAAAYATYLLSAVTSHEVFKTVELHADRFYDFLLFMDPANLAGVICEDPYSETIDSTISITMQWNIATFLPPTVQEYFIKGIKKYLVEIFKIKSKHSGSSRTPLRVLNTLTQGGTDQIPLDAEKLKETASIEAYIQKTLTRSMLRDVDSIMDAQRHAMMEEVMPDEFRFPLLPGSHLALTNPTLEYIKYMCAVISLVKEFANDVGVLKKNLLSHIGIREFSEEATFRNPCQPFKLPMVICRVCSTMRDFDFCRDPELLPTLETRGTTIRWQCPECECDYDRKAIEATLIDIVRRLVTSFQLQDLRCGKCKQVKSDNLSVNCNCSGAYQLTMSKIESRRKLRTIANVATIHGLGLLKVRVYVSLRLPSDSDIAGLRRILFR